MDWPAWRPLYDEVLADFRWTREDDEAARDLLHRLTEGHRLVPDETLRALLAGRVVTVVGPGPGVERVNPPEPWIATDGAAHALARRGLRPTLVTTDLDGDVEAQAAWNHQGTIVVVHAHGHNRDRLAEWVPRFDGPLVPTTPAEPAGRVRNHGGFTDGDRAVFLAAHCGARAVHLACFDLANPVPAPGKDPAQKRRKLAWAARLLPRAGVKVHPLAVPCGPDGPDPG